MNDPSQTRVVGPLAPYATGFLAELARCGYTSGSAGLQVQLMAHASRWLDAKGLGANALSPQMVELYVRARRGAGYTQFRSALGMKRILEYLHNTGALPLPPPAQATTPEEVLLGRYRRYLTNERGLTEGTAKGYINAIRPFLAGRTGPDGCDLEHLSSGDVAAFVSKRCPGQTRGSAKATVSGLRSLLNFLHVDGVLPMSLGGAVPAVACWRLAPLPRVLEPAQVRLLLSTCDQHTTMGRRDFAVLMLLVRLGLRAGEVATLGLDDIDWRSSEVVVRGKGNRAERLPLPADVGEAVANYLHRGRPVTAEVRTVLIRTLAPHRALTPAGVTQIVATAGQRAGLAPLSAHRLRHTAASQMLRGGASLAEVGQVLRHHRIATTAIYAKVDRGKLRLLARPWPGGTA